MEQNYRDKYKSEINNEIKYEIRHYAYEFIYGLATLPFLISLAITIFCFSTADSYKDDENLYSLTNNIENYEKYHNFGIIFTLVSAVLLVLTVFACNKIHKHILEITSEDY